MSENDERIVRLEMLAAEQERIIAELSAEIATQWKAIERFERGFEVLKERFLALEEQSAPDVPVTKPPHW